MSHMYRREREKVREREREGEIEVDKLFVVCRAGW